MSIRLRMLSASWCVSGLAVLLVGLSLAGCERAFQIQGTVLDSRNRPVVGAAIDINVAYADYWRWSKDANAPVWKNRIPIEIVRTFEQYGLIWGGYWYHFDTMHFEYRPELLPGDE